VTASITDDTHLVLLKGSDVTSQSADVMKQLALVLDKGGYIAIERPTASQLDYFIGKIQDILTDIVEDYTEELFDLTPEQMQATVRASMAGRLSTRQANLSNFTRADADNDIAAELVIFGPVDTYFEDPLDTDAQLTMYYTDTDGNPLEDDTASHYSWTLTDYHYGLVADNAADWLNDIEASMDTDEDPWYSPEEAAARRASRRASANAAINDLTSATETFTYSGQMFFATLDGKVVYKPARVMLTVSNWSTHNVSSHKDFYYVKENVLLRMGADNDGFDPFYCRNFATTQWMTQKGNAFTKYYDALWYGNFLTRYDASLNLTGAGTITCEAATPETANQVTTQTVSTSEKTESSVETTVTGKVTAGTGGANISIDYEHMWSTTTGNSISMANSRGVKDLEVTKNTEGTKVSWTYKGRIPKAQYLHESWQHESPGDILVNDANLLNDACWSVAEPKGQYQLNIGSFPVTGALVYNSSIGQKVNNLSTEKDNSWTVKLTVPNRSIQTWRMFVTVDEWQNGFKQGAQTELVSTISKKFPDLYRSVFKVGELDDGSLNNASIIILYTKQVFDIYKDLLQSIAKSYGIKKFTITWSSDNNLETKDGYVVTVK